MNDEFAFVLTSRDFALLESLVHNWREPFPGAGERIRRKLASATVVFPGDVPANVVTVNSRVRFRADAERPEERTIVKGHSEARCGMTLPLTSPRGVALLGAAVGQTVEALRPDGSGEILLIEAVPYQPLQTQRPVGLRVISSKEPPDASSLFPSTRSRPEGRRFCNDDDPGPGAA